MWTVYFLLEAGLMDLTFFGCVAPAGTTLLKMSPALTLGFGV
jgi:hypothetical protein